MTSRARTTRRTLFLGLLAIAATAILSLWLSSWRIAGAIMEWQSKNAEIVVTPITDDLYMLDATLGERQIGASLLASIGPDGVLLVDTPMTRALTEKTRLALSALRSTENAQWTVINTHPHPDHTRGNAYLRLLGPEGAHVLVAHERTRQRLARPPRPFPLLPAAPALDPEFLPSTTLERSHRLSMNGHRITLLHLGPSHTDADLVVLFEEAKVAHVGDLFHGVGGHAGIDWSHSGGNAGGLVTTLDTLLDRLPDDVKIVCGHGGVGQVWTMADLTSYRDMVADVTSHVASLIDEDRTLEETLEIGLPKEWQPWFDKARTDSVMHGPPEGWLENLYLALSSVASQRRQPVVH